MKQVKIKILKAKKLKEKVIALHWNINGSANLYIHSVNLFSLRWILWVLEFCNSDLWHVFPMKNYYIYTRKINTQTNGQQLNPFDSFGLFSMCPTLQSRLFRAFELFWSNPQNPIETSFVEIFIFCLGLRELCSLGSLLSCRNTYSKIQANTDVSELSTLPLQGGFKLGRNQRVCWKHVCGKLQCLILDLDNLVVLDHFACRNAYSKYRLTPSILLLQWEFESSQSN